MKRLVIFLFSLITLTIAIQASDFEQRCNEYNDYYATNGENRWLYGVFRQLARQSAGMPQEEDGMYDVISVIKSNHDCNDFTLNGLLRMIYLDKDRQVMTQAMKKAAEDRILDFKYWWDDERRDTTYRCYHTENHQALYHTAELLAGQLYKKRKFTDGKNGFEHIRHAKERLLPWLDYRFRFGFSEWLSTYYDVEVLLLTNLYDFAEDKEIRRRAGNVLNLLFFDMALNSRDGYLCGAAGRTYASSLLDGTHNTGAICWLAFGVGDYCRNQMAGAIALASSSYRCPELIADIARDSNADFSNLQRTSINVEDASNYGLDYNNELHTHLFWGMQEFIHPKVIAMSKAISEKHDAWPYRDYDRYIEQYRREEAATGKATDRDRFALSEANIVTRRTPHYVLSSLQDYRKGLPGYQQHPWMLTFSPEALVYTNHPGGTNLRNSPNYWAGNEILPRSAQHGSVALCIYNIPADFHTAFSHAYFPVDAMDETLVKGNWLFGRVGTGFVALYSSEKPRLTTDFRGKLCDVVADSPDNIWICQAGSADEWPDFYSFVRAVSEAEINVDGQDLRYVSPTEGEIRFGWDSPLVVDGCEQALRHSCRYDNPYCHAEFDAECIEIKHNGLTLTMSR